MVLSIVQLSDIHFRSSNNSVTAKLPSLVAAVRAASIAADGVLLIYSGDIADSGAEEEYQEAHEFLNEVCAALKAEKPDLVILEVFVPGNHDSAVGPSPSRIRDLVLAELLKDELDVKRQADLINGAIACQKNFFQFLQERAKEIGTADPSIPQLSWTETVEICGKKIKLLCINTSWMSTLQERQGNLLAYVSETDTKREQVDLWISVLHHPFNWLESNNARILKMQLESISDVILTGHEHSPDSYTKVGNWKSSKAIGIEGGVLQETEHAKSEFNVLSLDFEKSSIRVRNYLFKKGLYTIERDSDWMDFAPNEHSDGSLVRLTPEYVRLLNDVGTGFTHPLKPRLTLADLFVWPDFRVRDTFDAGDDGSNTLIKGSNLLKKILSLKKVVIYGPEHAGKTAVAKTLYSDFLSQEMLPLYVTAAQLASRNTGNLDSFIKALVKEQYHEECSLRIEQAAKIKKTIIIDDFHPTAANKRNLSSIFSALASYFENIVILARDLIDIIEFARDVKDCPLLGYQRVELSEFGHRLRGEMIERWHRLGADDEDDLAVARNVETSSRLINTLLGNNVVPSYPLFVLSILQGQEVFKTHSTVYGAYGHQYDFLIKDALRIQGSTLTVDTLYTFLSNLAYGLYRSQETYVSESRLLHEIQAYQSRYRMTFNPEKMIRCFLDSRLLSKEFDRYRFKYPYIFYYFVALHMSKGLSGNAAQEYRALAKEMAATTHVKANTNIIIFLIYFSQDSGLILEIVDQARKIFSDLRICDLSDTSFLDKISTPKIELEIDDGSHRQAREEALVEQDEAESLTPRGSSDGDSNYYELDSLSEHNRAVKALEIMGQVIRNFPGTLEGDIKKSVAEECYLLGLRVLQSIINLITEDLDIFRDLIESYVSEHFGGSTTSRKEKVDSYLYQLYVSVAYNIILKICNSVGSSHLQETYKDVLEAQQGISVELIDVSLKIDQEAQFPLSSVVELFEAQTDNRYVQDILRSIVIRHLRLFPEQFKVRQQVGDRMKIKVNSPQLIISSARDPQRKTRGSSSQSSKQKAKSSVKTKKVTSQQIASKEIKVTKSGSSLSAPLEDLKEKIAQKKVIAFLGTGVSIASSGGAKAASWLGLLRNGIDYCANLDHRLSSDWQARMHSQLQQGETDLTELLAVAENISRRLGGENGGEFSAWLTQTVGLLKPVDSTIISAVDDLQIPIITTNYDGLIEQVTHREAVTWKNATNAQRIFRGEDNAVLHLHGYWRDPQSVILGVKSYSDIQNDGPIQAILRAMMISHSVLFIGYGAGLEDPNFSALLGWAAKTFSSQQHRHYRLAKTSLLLETSAQHAPEQRVHVLDFGPEHSDLPKFLRSLKVGTGS